MNEKIQNDNNTIDFQENKKRSKKDISIQDRIQEAVEMGDMSALQEILKDDNIQEEEKNIINSCINLLNSKNKLKNYTEYYIKGDNINFFSEISSIKEIINNNSNIVSDKSYGKDLILKLNNQIKTINIIKEKGYFEKIHEINNKIKDLKSDLDSNKMNSLDFVTEVAQTSKQLLPIQKDLENMLSQETLNLDKDITDIITCYGFEKTREHLQLTPILRQTYDFLKDHEKFKEIKDKNSFNKFLEEKLGKKNFDGSNAGNFIKTKNTFHSGYLINANTNDTITVSGIKMTYLQLLLTLLYDKETNYFLPIDSIDLRFKKEILNKNELDEKIVDFESGKNGYKIKKGDVFSHDKYGPYEILDVDEKNNKIAYIDIKLPLYKYWDRNDPKHTKMLEKSIKVYNFDNFYEKNIREGWKVLDKKGSDSYKNSDLVHKILKDKKQNEGKTWQTIGTITTLFNWGSNAVKDMMEDKQQEVAALTSKRLGKWVGGALGDALISESDNVILSKIEKKAERLSGDKKSLQLLQKMQNDFNKINKIEQASLLIACSKAGILTMTQIYYLTGGDKNIKPSEPQYKAQVMKYFCFAPPYFPLKLESKISSGIHSAIEKEGKDGNAAISGLSNSYDMMETIRLFSISETDKLKLFSAFASMIDRDFDLENASISALFIILSKHIDAYDYSYVQNWALAGFKKSFPVLGIIISKTGRAYVHSLAQLFDYKLNLDPTDEDIEKEKILASILNGTLFQDVDLEIVENELYGIEMSSYKTREPNPKTKQFIAFLKRNPKKNLLYDIKQIYEKLAGFRYHWGASSTYEQTKQGKADGCPDVGHDIGYFPNLNITNFSPGQIRDFLGYKIDGPNTRSDITTAYLKKVIKELKKDPDNVSEYQRNLVRLFAINFKKAFNNMNTTESTDNLMKDENFKTAFGLVLKWIIPKEVKNKYEILIEYKDSSESESFDYDKIDIMMNNNKISKLRKINIIKKGDEKKIHNDDLKELDEIEFSFFPDYFQTNLNYAKQMANNSAAIEKAGNTDLIAEHLKKDLSQKSKQILKAKVTKIDKIRSRYNNNIGNKLVA